MTGLDRFQSLFYFVAQESHSQAGSARLFADFLRAASLYRREHNSYYIQLDESRYHRQFIISWRMPFTLACPGRSRICASWSGQLPCLAFGSLQHTQTRGERIVFSGPNTNTNTIRLQKCGRIRIRILFGFRNIAEYEYEYYSGSEIWPNTNTNNIRSATFVRIRIRILRLFE